MITAHGVPTFSRRPPGGFRSGARPWRGRRRARRDTGSGSPSGCWGCVGEPGGIARFASLNPRLYSGIPPGSAVVLPNHFRQADYP
jgi:hypothetical protein